jgi:outer membrane lipoprotein carrier protein
MHRITYILFFVVFAVQGQTKMTVSEASALKEIVKQQAAITKTIASDFTQYKHLDFLTNDIITSGKLNFKAPDRIKWEYVKPFEYAVLFKNETIFINDQGNKSKVDIGSSKLFKQLNHLIINSVKGDMFDDAEFDISYFKEKNNSLVYFKPKDLKFANYISEFQILFNTNGEVMEVKMMEPSGDYTKIVFKNRTINNIINDSVFSN